MVNHALVLSFSEECMEGFTARNPSASLYLFILFWQASFACLIVILSNGERVNVSVYQAVNTSLYQCIYKLMQISRHWRRSWRCPSHLLLPEGKNGKAEGREQKIERGKRGKK